MKTLIFLITIIATTSLLRAGEKDEVIWETEQIRGLNEVEVSPLGEVFYNTKDSIVQVRSVETGELIEEILFPNTARLDAISISADGRLMAVSGQPKYIFIYDLVEKQEVKRLTALVFEREEFGENVEYEAEQWVCSSISPDGTKVTGVAISDRGRNKSNFIVFDIESENVIYESRRLSYDMSNPTSSNYWWRSAEFTPDGNYIVSQLDYGTENSYGPDSIYIHDANNFEVYDVVLNSFDKDNPYFNLNPNKNMFTYYSSDRLTVNVFDFTTNESLITNIETKLWTFTFLRTRDYIVYGHDNGLKTYDFKNDITISDYELVTNVFITSLDDSKLLANYHGHIYCLKTFLSKTSIENDYEEEIIISPNPTSGYINIEIECFEPNINFSIFDLDSTMISQNTSENQSGSFTIDFTQYPAGVYFLQFKCNNEMRSYKIIKEG